MICVLPCTHQSDCASAPGFFCDPGQANSLSGYCVPPSPAHCLSCQTNSDCGPLSEVCTLVAGDTAPACHVDCGIAATAACPPGYVCDAEDVDGGSMELCVPTSGVCLNSEGGFCDRVTAAQPCARSEAAGTCTGERTCQPDGQFSTCGAADPQCLAACSDTAPANCTESVCAGAANTAQFCGSCAASSACPGLADNGINDNVTCASGTTCTFSCVGENYDVDADPTDGCEQVDSPQGNHTDDAADNFAPGGLDCDDGDSALNLAGQILSDTRVHENPGIDGFDSFSGSAPDWFTVVGTGGFFCEDDVNLNLQIYSSINPTCYEITFTDSSGDFYQCQTDATGYCSFSEGSGSYSSGDTLWWEVSKICDTTTIEDVSYTITGHL